MSFLQPRLARASRVLAGTTVGLTALAVGPAAAQTAVTLADTTKTTTLTAAVVEQARIKVPASLTFSVTNVSAPTTNDNVAITVSNIVLLTATKQLRIMMMANATSFTPPVASATTWGASDVSWSAGPGGGPNQWQNAVGSAGVLSSAAYNTVGTCNADAAGCSIARLAFTLGAKPAVKRSGNHVLTVTWKFESIGS